MSSVNTRALGVSPPSLALVRATFVLGVVSTTVHYAHNFVHAQDYPPVPFFPSAQAYQIGIAVFWPTLTVLGVWALVQYGRGAYERALPALALWSMLGATSVGHFLGGVPDIPAYAMFTISTDFATGVVMLVLLGQARAATRPAGSTAGLEGSRGAA